MCDFYFAERDGSIVVFLGSHRCQESLGVHLVWNRDK